ncbi:GntR family transcriptional regulator [Acidimangrovimonas sediminis]|uniref:GntR family transcriptional regulator n=1 Tax=Acidimangrovimonas sediminis TaxID=2056283 RepID=UPI000C8011E1|nr:GntR family transcriptional regulator [Acidimangrovimonas sediminis]
MNDSEKDARFGGRARYAVLAEALLDDIRSGRYPVGSLLPPETELCREFDLSRHTVREAIRRLVDLGLLSRQAGVGTTVRANRIASRYVQTGEGDPALMQYVRDVNLHITSAEDIVAEGDLARFLGSKEGQGWLHISGERFLSGEQVPIALTEIWIARPYRGVIDPEKDPTEPIYAMIERRYGLATAEIRQTIDAVILADDAARRLGVDSGAPGLKIVRSYVSDSGELYETAVSLHPAGRFSYSSTYRVETGAQVR